MLMETFMAAYRVQTLNIFSRQKASGCCHNHYFKRCQDKQFPALFSVSSVPKIQIFIILVSVLGLFL